MRENVCEVVSQWHSWDVIDSYDAKPSSYTEAQCWLLISASIMAVGINKDDHCKIYARQVSQCRDRRHRNDTTAVFEDEDK